MIRMLFPWLGFVVALLIAASVDAAEEVQNASSNATSPGTNGEHQESIAGFGLWLFFIFVVAVSLVLDHLLGAHYAELGKVIRGAIYSSTAWVGLGFGFAFFLMILKGGSAGFTFLTGYLVEESLSVDNLVVIALIFRTFRIKPQDQGPVLKWGILGAVVFRLVFVFAGVWLLEHLHAMMYVFGGLLLYSAYKMYADDDEEDDMMNDHTSGNSWMMKCLTFFVPYNAQSRSHKFIEWVDEQPYATPMLAALVVVELSDLIFAIDSIPCILGLTHDLFLVFSSNVLAILGLRSLYLILAEALDKVQNLKKGLAAVLAFVGTKMMLGDYFPLPQSVSLLVIFGILGATALTSINDLGGGKKGSGSNVKCLSSVLPI